jgi:hypothetical protein
MGRGGPLRGEVPGRLEDEDAGYRSQPYVDVLPRSRAWGGGALLGRIPGAGLGPFGRARIVQHHHMHYARHD